MVTAKHLANFYQLQRPTSTGTLSAVRAFGLTGIWIARDSDGNALLLVEARFDENLPPPILLRYFEFEPWRSCTVIEADGPARRFDVSLLKCTAPEPELQDYFFRASASILADLPVDVGVGDVGRAVDRLASLFRGLSLSPNRSLQGLWAELFLLSRAHDIPRAAASWQSLSHSLIDFAAGLQGIEVKSSSGEARRHRFKLRQLQPREGHTWYVASLVLRQSASGTSLLDLWDLIEQRLESSPIARQRIASIIASAAGEDWRSAESFRCDEAAAAESIVLFDTTTIPRVGDSGPPEVTDVEFSVDFANIPRTPVEEIAARGELFSWMFGS
jgi:hypothetical protein